MPTDFISSSETYLPLFGTSHTVKKYPIFCVADRSVFYKKFVVGNYMCELVFVHQQAKAIPPNWPQLHTLPCDTLRRHLSQQNPDRCNFMTQAGPLLYSRPPSRRTDHLVHRPPHQSTSGQLAALLIDRPYFFRLHSQIGDLSACLSTITSDDATSVVHFKHCVYSRSGDITLFQLKIPLVCSRISRRAPHIFFSKGYILDHNFILLPPRLIAPLGYHGNTQVSGKECLVRHAA